MESIAARGYASAGSNRRERSSIRRGLAAWYLLLVESLDAQIARCEDSGMRRHLGDALHACIVRGDYEDALRICDAVISYPRTRSNVLCNALWVVQTDNTGLPFDEALAKRVLAASVFLAAFNPPIHINAAAVYAHFDDPNPVIRHLLLAKKHEQDLSAHLDEPLFDRFRSHARWSELTGDAPASVEDPTWMEVAIAACEAGEYANAFPALWWFWEETRSTRVADLIDALTERAGHRVGYQSESLEEAIRDAPETLLEELKNVSRWEYKPDETRPAFWLAENTTDPRFSIAALRALGDCSLLAQKPVQDGLEELCVQLEGLRDKRIAAELPEVAVRFANGAVPLGQAPLGRWLASRLEQLADALNALAEPALTSAESAACSRLEALLGPATRVSLSASAATPNQTAEVRKPSERDPLLTLWRKTRDPRVAEVLDLQDLRSPPFSDLAQAVTDAVIPGESSERDVGAFDAAQHVWEAKHKDDPRAASALIRLLEDPPFVRFALREENGVEKFWQEVMSACVALDDPRLIAPLRALSARVLSLTWEGDAEAEYDFYMAFPLGPRLRNQLPKCADKIRTVPKELSDAEEALLEAAHVEYAPERRSREEGNARAAKRLATEASLVRAIVDDLDADAPRLAYADFLGDDPRADFIRLQIEGRDDDEPEMEHALQELHEGQWVDPIPHLVDDLVFERGFPVSCTLELHPHRDMLRPEYVGDPVWATFRAIRTSPDSWRIYDSELSRSLPSTLLHDLIAHPMMRSLTHLDGVSVAGLFALIDRGRTHYELVAFEPSDVDALAWPRVTRALLELPHLHTLRVRFCYLHELERILPLLEASAGLEHLELHIAVEGPPNAELTPAIAQALFDSAFERIALTWNEDNRDYGWNVRHESNELRLTKLGGGWNVTAKQLPRRFSSSPYERGRRATQFWLRPFITKLGVLPKSVLRSFRLADSDVSPSQSALDELSRALAAFPGLESVELFPAGDTPEKVMELIAALEDPERAERACELLGSHKDAAARTALARHAAHNESPTVRHAALEAVAELADESIVATLCEGLNATPAGLKTATLLGHLRAKSAIPALLAYAPCVEESYARGYLAQAFARINASEAIPVLLASYAKEPHPDTLMSLGRLGAAEARALALACEPGDSAASVTLAFVGEAGDADWFGDVPENSHRALSDLSVSLLDPDAAESAQILGAMNRALPGESEHCAWLLLELRARVGHPRAQWDAVAEGVREWRQECLSWMARAPGKSYGMDNRAQRSLKELLDEVAAAWEVS